MSDTDERVCARCEGAAKRCDKYAEHRQSFQEDNAQDEHARGEAIATAEELGRSIRSACLAAHHWREDADGTGSRVEESERPDDLALIAEWLRGGPYRSVWIAALHPELGDTGGKFAVRTDDPDAPGFDLDRAALGGETIGEAFAAARAASRKESRNE